MRTIASANHARPSIIAPPAWLATPPATVLAVRVRTRSISLRTTLVVCNLAQTGNTMTTPRTVASLALLFLIALRRSAPRRPIQHAALVSPLTRKVPMAYIASNLATRESITTLTLTLASSAQPSIIAKQAR